MSEQKLKQDVGIGHNIKRLRNRSGLTQEEVAKKMQLLGCNITRVAYIKIERETQHIKVSELTALQKILHAEYSEFFEQEL